MHISCIIPTRNRCAMVLDAIASVCAQEMVVSEIIVVDDGSSDDTGSKIAGLYPRVHLITLSGLGAGQARNAGATAATGDILMFLDSDDRWLPHHSRALAKVVEDNFSVAYGITRTQDLVRNETFLIPGPKEECSGECYDALTRWCFLVPSSMAVTRKAFMETGGFGKEELGEDWAFFLRLAHLFPFGFAREAGPITERLLHPGSLCASTSRNQLQAMVRRQLDIVEETGGTAGSSSNLLRMATWLDRKKMQEISVQKWYLAMKKENIL